MRGGEPEKRTRCEQAAERAEDEARGILAGVTAERWTYHRCVSVLDLCSAVSFLCMRAIDARSLSATALLCSARPRVTVVGSLSPAPTAHDRARPSRAKPSDPPVYRASQRAWIARRFRDDRAAPAIDPERHSTQSRAKLGL